MFCPFHVAHNLQQKHRAETDTLQQNRPFQLGTPRWFGRNRPGFYLNPLRAKRAARRTAAGW